MRIKPTFTTLGFIIMLANAAHAEPLAGSSLAQITGSVTGNTAQSMGAINSANTIDGGLNGAAGITVIQQNNGDNNLLSGAISVIDSPETITGMGIATSAAILNTVVSGNITSYASVNGAPTYSNIISGAFNGASGVILVQQNNGSNNVISAAISVAGSGTPFSFGQVQQISDAVRASSMANMEEGGADSP